MKSTKFLLILLVVALLSSTTMASAATISVERSAAAPSPAAQDGICKQTGRISLLLFAESLQTNAHEGNDAVFLVGLDFDDRQVNIVPLPNELVLPTITLTKQNVTAATISEIYRTSKLEKPTSEKAGMQNGLDNLLTTLEENFNYKPNFYVGLSQEVLVEVIDDMGGLKINLPREVDGSAEGLGVFKQGEQVLSGEQIISLISIRKPAGADVSQVQRLLWVFEAMGEQFDTSEIRGSIPSLMTMFYSNSVTNLNIFSLLPYTCLTTDHDFDLNYVEFPKDYYTVGANGDLHIRNVQELSTFLNLTVGKK